jgi:hypothetical protein
MHPVNSSHVSLPFVDVEAVEVVSDKIPEVFARAISLDEEQKEECSPSAPPYEKVDPFSPSAPPSCKVEETLDQEMSEARSFRIYCVEEPVEMLPSFLNRFFTFQEGLGCYDLDGEKAISTFNQDAAEILRRDEGRLKEELKRIVTVLKALVLFSKEEKPSDFAAVKRACRERLEVLSEICQEQKWAESKKSVDRQLRRVQPIKPRSEPLTRAWKKVKNTAEEVGERLGSAVAAPFVAIGDWWESINA